MQPCRMLLAAGALALSGVAAMAEPAKPDVAALVTADVLEEMRAWIETDIVRVSIDTQNKRLRKLDQATIDTLDAQWKAERESADKPLIAATLSNPLSIYLSRMQGRSLGLYAEIFIMDQNGLNVGQSSVTSDFWQGDEGKFQKTYQVAPDAVFFDEPEFDDEMKVWRGQVNFTVTDTAGKAIGAATVEFNLTELARRAEAGA